MTERIGRTVEIDATWADRGVKAGVAEVDAALGRTEQAAESATRGMRRVREEQSMGQKVLQNWQQDLTRMFMGYVGFQGAMRLGEFVIDVDKAAARTRMLADVVSGQLVGSGRSYVSVLADMRKETMGLVNDQTLLQQLYGGMDAFSKMGMAPAQSLDVIRTTARFASQQAQLRGMSAEETSNRLMTGLSRGSWQFLDDFGIRITGLNAGLSEEAQKREVIRQALDQMKQSLDDTTDAVRRNLPVWDRIGVWWENQTGKGLASLPSGAPFGQTSGQAQTMINAIQAQHQANTAGGTPVNPWFATVATPGGGVRGSERD